MKLTKSELKKLIKEELLKEEDKWLPEADVESWEPLFEEWYNKNKNVLETDSIENVARTSFGQGWQESIRNRNKKSGNKKDETNKIST